MICHIDHLVLTVRSLEATCRFYERVLKFTRTDAPGRPVALHFGDCKINVHQVEHTFEPKAANPTPGSADSCLITGSSLDVLIRQVELEGVGIEKGPVERTGGIGKMTSIYFRDPDGNLVEVSKY